MLDDMTRQDYQDVRAECKVSCNLLGGKDKDTFGKMVVKDAVITVTIDWEPDGNVEGICTATTEAIKACYAAMPEAFDPHRKKG